MGRLLTLLRSVRAEAGPPVAGASLWLDRLRSGALWQDAARTTPAGVGDPVGSWYDPTNAVGATASGTARPTLGTAGLTFDGVNDVLDAAIGARAQPETLYVVARADATINGTGNTLLDATDAINRGRLFYQTSFPHLTAFSGAALNNTAVAQGVLLVACYVMAGASSVLRINTSEQAGNAGATSGTGLRIGSSGGTPQQFFGGEVRAVLRYAAAHDATQRATTVAWLAARHGVSL